MKLNYTTGGEEEEVKSDSYLKLQEFSHLISTTT